MYSHGSSARAAGGKRGHGGRNYLPPPERRRDPNTVPPPLKQCNCLIQLHLPEYQSTAERRLHTTFGGGSFNVQTLEKTIRQRYQVHLVLPGRNQQGAVGVAGASYQNVIPATAWLLQQVVLEEITSVVGKIQLNVKNVQDPGIDGTFTILSSKKKKNMMTTTSEQVSSSDWLFQSSNSENNSSNQSISLKIRQCRLWSEEGSLSSSNSSPSASSSDHRPPKEVASTTTASSHKDALATALDNASFTLGQTTMQQVQFLLDPYNSGVAFCLGRDASTVERVSETILSSIPSSKEK